MRLDGLSKVAVGLLGECLPHCHALACLLTNSLVILLWALTSAGLTENWMFPCIDQIDNFERFKPTLPWLLSFVNCSDKCNGSWERILYSYSRLIHNLCFHIKCWMTGKKGCFLCAWCFKSRKRDDMTHQFLKVNLDSNVELVYFLTVWFLL